MGTTKSGRYLNTKGSGRSVSDYALVHSNEGTFKWKQVRINRKPAKRIRLDSGGHGQMGMELLDKYQVTYNIVKTYHNGVRVGNVPDHKERQKRNGIGQSWFPASWDSKKIKRAGEYVAGLKRNRNIPEGAEMLGTYKGVIVGVRKTNGKIATIYPDSNQTPLSKRRTK